MSKIKTLWSCTECGHTQSKWTGSCFSCHKWNTFVEEVQSEERFLASTTTTVASSRPMKLSECQEKHVERISTGMKEFDRVLGGGLVPGSLVLIGGEPGMGKSTLMLQTAYQLSLQGMTVLYVCGEESVEQTAMRAKRLSLDSDSLYLFAETLFSKIEQQVDAINPDILVIDSIQIVYKEQIPSSPGSVAQVREVATSCMHLAKRKNMATFLIGHVTKSGDIAGPKVLEHLVDTVLDFDGDVQHGYRMLRGIKNRFGPTDDLVVFQMTQTGLKEVEHPSHVFLEDGVTRGLGSMIIPIIEGTRSFLVEVQALVVHSAFPSPMRKSMGLHPSRLALWLAVLEKQLGYRLHQKDVFVSMAGGLKVLEPAIDLGVMLAIASSFSRRLLSPTCVVLGEVGLGGEIRGVPRIGGRLKEAAHRGFDRAIIPKRNSSELSDAGHLKVYPVQNIAQAVSYLDIAAAPVEYKEEVLG